MPRRKPVIEHYIVSGREFRDVARALMEVDKTLPRQFRKELRTQAKPLMAKAKAAVKALPTHSRHHSGLRNRVARGVKLVVPRSNASIRIGTSMVDRTEAIIPRGLDTEKGWRHPVFGDAEKWVQQEGGSWFREPIAEGRDELRRGLIGVLEKARDQIADAGS